ncbi:MAG: peptide deformylase [Alphaproteobacteria bacterium]
MAKKLEILTAPDPRLKKKSKPVAQVDAKTRALMDDMLETMYAAPGIGLAAPQIGVLQRIIVLDLGEREGERKQAYKMVNPELVWVSDDDNTYEEGCLSVPEHYGDVVRPKSIRVQYLDEHNKKQELAAEGLLATCIQHEIDHLDGVLFIDHLTALKRNIILRKLLKEKKQGGAKSDHSDGAAL